MKQAKNFLTNQARKYWLEAILLIATIAFVILAFKLMAENPQADNNVSLLINLLTVNGIFSAILITYLFTRISWMKERKLEYLNEAMKISQKIHEYRRILKTLMYRHIREEKP